MAGYGEDADFTAWLASNGLTLPEGALAVAVLRQRGAAYIDGLYEPKLPGSRVGGYTQERAQPRVGGTFNGEAIPSEVIPQQWVHASFHAAYQEAISPGSLSVTASAAGAVKREKVGVLEVEYLEGSGDAVADGLLRLSQVEGLLSPFFAAPMPAVFVV